MSREIKMTFPKKKKYPTHDPTLPFRKNYHLSRKCKIGKITTKIETYDKRYSPPKYLQFIKRMIEAGWNVRIYESGVSKYVFVQREKELYKIRFSNHVPLFHKQQENDCDYYVGVSHGQVHTTEQIYQQITSPKLF